MANLKNRRKAFRDPYFDYVSLLMHCNGADGPSTPILDSSRHKHTITSSGTANCQIDTDQSVFGGASLYFNGSGNASVNDHVSLRPGTGDFCIDFWIRCASFAANRAIIAKGGVVAGGLAIWQGSTTGLIRASLGDGTDYLYETGATKSTNTWYHIRVNRVSGTLGIYRNGVLNITQSDTVDISHTGTFYIGDGLSGFNRWSGHIDDLRYTVGNGRGTANFTPPAAPYHDY